MFLLTPFLGLAADPAPPGPSLASPQQSTVEPLLAHAVSAHDSSDDAGETADDATCCGAKPDIWLVCTRSAPCCCNLENGTDRITFRHLVDCHWQSADLAQFLAADDPSVCTVFLIPGNRADAGTAVEFGMLGAQRIARYGCGRKIRVVIWSWPADRTALRNRPDVKEKTDRSDCEAWYLAWLINQMNPQVEIGLAGYSLGARAIGGALQLLAGGKYDCRTLEVLHQDRKRMGVAMFAAAIECDWFRAGRPMDRTLTQVDRILVTTNPSDSLLRFFPLQAHPNTNPALGFHGPCCLGDLRCVLTIRNVSGMVGRDHNWRPYLRSCSINRLTAEHVLGPCGQPAADASPSDSPPSGSR